MGFFSFGKRVKNQRFNYIPRHYDPAKEDLEERLRMASEESNTEVSKLRIRSGLRQRSRGDKDLEKTLKRSANIRLVVIIGMLIAVSYYLLTSEGITKFIIEMSG